MAIITPFEVIAPVPKTLHIILQVVDQENFIMDIYNLRKKFGRKKKTKTGMAYLFDVNNIIQKYKLSPIFQFIVFQAALSGRIYIPESISCYPIVTDKFETALVIHPDTTEKELLKTFKDLRKNMEGHTRCGIA